MTVTATISRDGEIYGTIEGAVGVFGATPVNREFVKMIGFENHLIDVAGDYQAFPFSILLGGKIVTIYSDGPAHANSEKQVVVVFDPTDNTYEAVDFYVYDTLTYDFSLLDPLMSDGDVITLKSFRIAKASGVISATIVATVDNGGITYALWSRVFEHNGSFYRTGYATAGTSYAKAALFSSVDQETWVYVSEIAGLGVLQFTEADVCIRADGSWISVIRETSGGSSTGNLYYVTSSDSGATWTSPALFDVDLINGVQPSLITLSNDDVILMAADRTGNSGASAGNQLSGFDQTGIAVWRLPAAAPNVAVANWTKRRMLMGIFSTDGGQPWPVEIADGEICSFCYARTSVGFNPRVFALKFSGETVA
nr:sialidase family protein [uncultured Cohaesibacter sp.]